MHCAALYGTVAWIVRIVRSSLILINSKVDRLLRVESLHYQQSAHISDFIPNFITSYTDVLAFFSG